MIRRDFLSQSAALVAGATLPTFTQANPATPVKRPDDRTYWLQVLTRIADPVLQALSRGELKTRMPVEAQPGRQSDRKAVTYLEALARLLAGMSPWLELDPDHTPEGQLRRQYVELALQSIHNAVDPASPDFMVLPQVACYGNSKSGIEVFRGTG